MPEPVILRISGGNAPPTIMILKEETGEIKESALEAEVADCLNGKDNAQMGNTCRLYCKAACFYQTPPDRERAVEYQKYGCSRK